MSGTRSFLIASTAEQTDLQLDSQGNLRHLLTMHNLEQQHITMLLDEAETYLSDIGKKPVRSTALQGRTVASLFFEPSTRTRISFELAAHRLGADFLNFNVNTSSHRKGESLLDTVYTLQAMQVDVLIVRDTQTGVPAYIANHANDFISVLNAGESTIAHPTQALLDLLTMRQQKKDFEKLTVAIIGDIKHSRVARSTSEALVTMGAPDIRLICPESLTPEKGTLPSQVKILHNVRDGISNADVIMPLRIQRERIENLADIPSVDQYYASYGLKSSHMSLAAPDAIVMHPGPMNRGIEIESKLADSAASVIQEQVKNGVAVRMALLAAVIRSLNFRDSK